MFDLKTRILVVDDMMTMRKLLSKACREIGFTDITEAGDGAEAWAAIGEAVPPFGLVISDWNMPHGSGMDLFKRIRADSRFGSLPFILAATEGEQSQITDATRAGVTEFLVKPFNAEMLREKFAAAHKKISES